MDAIIIIAIIAVIAFYFRRVDKVVTGVAIVDIFLRIFHYLVVNIEIKGISEYVEKYLPESIPDITSGCKLCSRVEESNFTGQKKSVTSAKTLFLSCFSIESVTAESSTIVNFPVTFPFVVVLSTISTGGRFSLLPRLAVTVFAVKLSLFVVFIPF